MNWDFTFNQYQLLLGSLKKKGYNFMSCSDYLEAMSGGGEETRERQGD